MIETLNQTRKSLLQNIGPRIHERQTIANLLATRLIKNVKWFFKGGLFDLVESSWPHGFSALASGSSGPGSSPGLGLCDVFLELDT